MKKLLLTASMLIPLSSCALWSDFKTPDTDKPDAFKTQLSPNAAAWPDIDWWKQFNSPELTTQIQMAQARNYDLKAAIARIREADAQVRIAGAALLPSVDATANAERAKGASGTSTLSTAGGHIRNSLTAELSASYELDFWGKNWASAEAARELAEASRYDWEVVNLTALSSVADNYFDMVAAEERLAIARENLKNANDLLAAIQKRFQQGTVSALDVAQQQSVVATQNAAVAPLELHLQQDMNGEAILVGALPENFKEPQEKLDAMAIPEVGSGIPSELLERRPDVKEAEAQLASAHANIIVARANFFPSISLTADGGYASSTLANLFSPGSRLWSIGAGLTQPIFEGGLLEGNLELSKAQYDELLQNYRKTVLSAFSDVENALTGVQKNADEVKAQKQAVDTARDAYEMTLRQLNGGTVDITTVLNTQRTLFAAQDAYAQAKLAHLQAIVSLYKALGGGWKNGDSPQQATAETTQPTPAPAQQTSMPQTAPAVTPQPPTLPPLTVDNNKNQ